MSETNDTDFESFWETFFHCTMEMDYKARRIGLFFLLLTCFLVGLCANSTVVWVNWPLRHTRRFDTFCTLNMSLVHLLVMALMPCVLLEVMMSYIWMWGHFLCKLTAFTYEFNSYCNSFFLAYMTVQNYRAVTGAVGSSGQNSPQPWGPAEKRRRTLIGVGFWLGALLLTPVVVTNVQVVEYHSPGCYIMPSSNYTIWVVAITLTSLIFQFLIPGAIIVTYNFRTARALQNSPELRSATGKDARMFHVYTAAFVLCWLPFQVANFIIMVDDLNPWLLNCDATNMLYFSISVLLPLTHLHYLANPILYNFLNPDFRKDLLWALARMVRGEAAPAATPREEVEDGAKARPSRPRGASESSATSQSDLDSDSKSQNLTETPPALADLGEPASPE